MRGLREVKIGKGGVGWLAGKLSLRHQRPTLTRLIRLITLNGMKASEEITDEQSRQVRILMRRPWLYKR